MPSGKEETVTVVLVRKVQGRPRDDARYILVTDTGEEFKTDPNAGTAYYLPNDFSLDTPISVPVRLFLTGGDRYKVNDWRLVEKES